MNLEDHWGDVVRKARLAKGVNSQQAALAAGLEPGVWAVIEESGVKPGQVHWEPLAALLELDSAKLRSLAEGWQPAEIDLSLWRELRQITTSDGGMAVSSYLVWDEVTRDAALFDTGWDAGPVLRLIEENGLVLRHLFLTHSHQDHVAALQPIRDRFPKVRLHSSSRHAPPEQRNRPQEFLHLGSLRITHRDTPGHAEDGVTYVIGNWPEDAPHVAVVGDALFAGSMGKAIGEAAVLARQKVKDQILSLPDETLLCPGHGPVTTVVEEKQHNPFFG